jgi:soluble lytic murein transglycosylase-like protein
MTQTSVVQIPLDTKEFEAFAEKFDTFRDHLAQTPEGWKKAGAEMTALAGVVEKMQSAARKAAGEKKNEDEGDKERFRRLRDSEGLWGAMAKSSSSMAKNVLDIGAGLLKWGSLLGGGALFGSLFGIDRLAHSIGDTRTQSMGFGVSPAQLQAFNVNFSKVMDTQGFLSSMTTMETDISKRTPWYALMNGKTMSGDTSADTLAMLQGIREFTKKTPEGLLGTMASAYQIPLDAQSLMRIKGMSDKEWTGTVASFQKDQSGFGLSNAGSKAWQDLSIQIERTGTLLKDKFALALEPLAPSLIKLSVAAGELIAAFLKSPAVKTAVDDVSKWLESLSKNMDAQSFLDTVSQLKLSLGDLADLIHTVAHPIDTAGGFVGRKMSEFHDWLFPDAASASASTKSYSEYLSRLDKHFDLPSGTMNRVWQTESGGALYPTMSKKGAIGAFQLMPDTARQYGANPYDPVQSANAGGEYLHELLQKYADMNKALAAYNYGPGNLDKVLAEHPKDWMRYVPAETQNYVSRQGGSQRSNGQSVFAPQGTGVTVTVINETGGNAAVSFSQLAAG